MKTPFNNLDKVLEHRVRLQIVSVLAIHESYDFRTLKELLAITDGSLATHMKALERERYISTTKSFVDRKPNTRYRLVERGKTAFKKHLDAMAEVIRSQRR